MTNSTFGRSSVSISGFEIPMVTVPDDALPVAALFTGSPQIVDMVFPDNIKPQNTTKRIITFNAKNAMVLKEGSEKPIKEK